MRCLRLLSVLVAVAAVLIAPAPAAHAAAGIQLTKSATLQLGANGTLEAGDTILYGFVIQNIGTVDLTGVDLDDPLLGYTDVTCGQTTLVSGQSTSCSTQYTLTQADVDAGSVSNTATACGTPPSGPDVCDTDGTSTPLGASKAIQLTKSATLDLGVNGTLEAGDKISFGFVIQNIGNVTLTGVDLDDALLGLTDAACGTTTLAPGASANCSPQYTITQADMDAGSVSNTATACGTPPSGPDVCDTDGTSTPLGASKAIQLTKSATLDLGVNGTLEAGDKISFGFVIQNIGNVTLTGVDLDDALLGLTDAACGTTTLAPGASANCSPQYTITQADMDAGSVSNTATACGTPPSGPDVCDTDGTSTPLAASKAVVLTLTATLDLGANNTLEAGDKILYGFAVQNTGNVTLTGVNRDDALLGLTNATCGTTTVAPGATTNCSTQYTIQQADIDAHGVTNDATVCGLPPSGPETCSAKSVHTTLVPHAIQVTLAATLQLGGNGTLEPGDSILYNAVITNTGAEALSNIALDLARLGLNGFACGVTTLTAGQSTSCAGSYALTQADFDARSVAATAVACGAPPSSAQICDDDSASTPLPAFTPPTTPTTPTTPTEPTSQQPPPRQQPATTTPTAKESAAALAAVVRALPSSRRKLLRRGAFTAPLSAPAPTQVQVQVFLGRVGAGAAKRVVLASGTAVVSANGRVRVTLTKQGRRELRRGRRTVVTIRVRVTREGMSQASQRVLVLKK